MSPLAEVAALFFKLGFTAFRGPAAHIGIMHNEVVVKRKWLTDEEFVDLLGVNEILLLFAGDLVFMLISNIQSLRNASTTALLPSGRMALAQAPVSFSFPVLFLTFLKIGAVLYGSGYVRLAFLRADFVLRLDWLANRQLLDAVAVEQVTAGPSTDLLGWYSDAIFASFIGLGATFIGGATPIKPDKSNDHHSLGI